MAKPQNTEYSLKKYLTTKNIVITVSVLLIVYIIGLVNPLTGPALQYPYYRVVCGREPIITTSIMGKSYYTPDMKTYDSIVSHPSAVYCTEEEAMKADFQKSSAQ